jgi:hypothetical protein
MISEDASDNEIKEQQSGLRSESDPELINASDHDKEVSRLSANEEVRNKHDEKLDSDEPKRST